MTTLDDFYGDGSADNTPECSFCGGQDGKLIVGVRDAYGPTHWYHEACKAQDDAKKGTPIAPTWDEAMDTTQAQADNTRLCMKEDSKGNWQPLFSKGFPTQLCDVDHPMLCSKCRSDNLAGNHRGMECVDCGHEWSPELEEKAKTSTPIVPTWDEAVDKSSDRMTTLFFSDETRAEDIKYLRMSPAKREKHLSEVYGIENSKGIVTDDAVIKLFQTSPEGIERLQFVGLTIC